MSKKNNKNNKNNKKKSTRKNYKIESLEPRLMMDATLDGWVDEADLARNASNLTVLSYAASSSNAWTKAYVETVQHKNSTTNEYEPCIAEDIIKEGNFDNVLKSSDITDDFKNALIGAVQDKLVSLGIDLLDEVYDEAHVINGYNNLFNHSLMSSPVHSSFAGVKDFVLETLVTKGGATSLTIYSHSSLFYNTLTNISHTVNQFNNFVNAIKVRCGLDLAANKITASEIFNHWTYASPFHDYTVQLTNSKSIGDCLSFEIGKKVFGTVMPVDTFRTDITDFSGVSVNLGLLGSSNVSFEGKKIIDFDGEGNDLERNEIDSVSVNAHFRQLNDTPVDKKIDFGFGTIDLSESRTTANGKALALTSSGAGLYTAGVDSNGNAIHTGNLEFTVNSIAGLNPAYATTPVHYVYEGNKWVWKDSLNNPATDIELLENFRIGPVMQKLSNLAYWLHENSMVTKENPNPLLLDDFGGLLGQNASEIAQFSSLLNDILAIKPKTLHDFLNLNSSIPISSPPAFTAVADFTSSTPSVTLQFHIEGPDIIGKNVSLLTNKLEELGFDVIDNQSLGLDITNRTLSLDLKVPLDGSLDFKTGDFHDPMNNGDLLTDVVSKVETNNYDDLGRVIGSAYVQADGDIVRFSFNSYSISVDDLKTVTIASTTVP